MIKNYVNIHFPKDNKSSRKMMINYAILYVENCFFTDSSSVTLSNNRDILAELGQNRKFGTTFEKVC